jgi:hypothetical protein
MRRTFATAQLSAVLGVLALAAGCQKEAAGTAPGPTPRASRSHVPAGEDPEVVAYANNKGWQLYDDEWQVDGKRIASLTVPGPDKPAAGKVHLTAEDYSMIARSKKARLLDLSDAEVTDDGLKVIAGAPALEAIFVGGEKVTDAGMKVLAGCKSLEMVGLVSTKKVTDEGVKELAALPNLHTLSLSGVTLTGAGFAAFAGSESLESVLLAKVNGLTDESVKHLNNLPNLNELSTGDGLGTDAVRAIVSKRMPDLFRCANSVIDDDLFATLVAKGWLYGPKSLSRHAPLVADRREHVGKIWVDGSRITDKGFQAVLDCTNAISVNLSGTKITDKTLQGLAAFGKLKLLALDETKVTAAGLQAVAGLPVEALSLQRCELSADEFKLFAKMPGLKELLLAGSKMKPEWLQHLGPLPNLRDLNLGHTGFNDSTVQYVASLPKLERLTLDGTELGDAGFQDLVKISTLKRLNVEGTKVTKEVYLKAKKEHPGLALTNHGYD